MLRKSVIWTQYVPRFFNTARKHNDSYYEEIPKEDEIATRKWNQDPPDQTNFWRGLSMTMLGLLIGLIGMLFTSLTQKGVTRSEMENYVKEFSPYNLDKGAISEHQAWQDRELGRVAGRQEEVMSRLNKIESKIRNQ